MNVCFVYDDHHRQAPHILPYPCLSSTRPGVSFTEAFIIRHEAIFPSVYSTVGLSFVALGLARITWKQIFIWILRHKGRPAGYRLGTCGGRVDVVWTLHGWFRVVCIVKCMSSTM